MSSLININTTLLSVDELKKLDTESLKELLGKTIAITADYLKYIAKVWQELEIRGENLSSLRTGLTRYLPLINQGKVDAQAVIKFAGQESLLKNISELPILKQAEIVQGKKFIFVKQKDDSFYTELVHLENLHIRHYPQIFGKDFIRDEEQQKRYLLKLELKAENNKEPAPRKKKVTFNRETSSIKCSTISIRIQDIISAFKDREDKKLFISMFEDNE